mgnify:CR=1 FL=1
MNEEMGWKTGEKGVKTPKNGFFWRKMQKNEKKLLKNLVEPEIVCTFATAMPLKGFAPQGS